MSAPANIVEIIGESDPDAQGELFRALRKQHNGQGAYYDPLLGVVVLGFDNARTLLMRQGKGLDVSSAVYRPEKFSGAQGAVMQTVADMMIAVDGEIHKRDRRPVTALFTRRRLLEEMAEPVTAIAAELLDPQRQKGQMELVKDFAGVFPVRVIMEMLGIPAKHLPLLKRLSDDIAPAATNPLLASPEVSERGHRGLAELRTFYNEQFANVPPSDSTIGQAMNRLMTAPGLTERERFSQFVLLFIAGHETTSRVIAGTMSALLTDPAKLDRVRSDPHLISSVVSEGLRWCSPFQAIFRRATTEIDLGDGVVLGNGHGSRAALILAAANRDPNHFVNPDEFRVDRYDNRYGTPPEESLAFGVGPHRCLGAELAKIELAVALYQLVHLPGLRLASAERVKWESTLTFRGPAKLGVQYERHTERDVPSPSATMVAVAASLSGSRQAEGRTAV